jgi:hypothetical protein
VYTHKMNNSRRYNSKSLLFDGRDLSTDMVNSFVDNNDLGGLVGSIFNDGATHTSYYGYKKKGSLFNYPNGNISLAKKLGCNPKDLHMTHVTKGNRMPDGYYGKLDPDNLNHQIKYTRGDLTVELIKATIGQNMAEQRKNKETVDAAMATGTDACVDSGLIKVGQRSAMNNYVSHKKEVSARDNRLLKDMARGDEYVVTCPPEKSTKEYIITSQKGDGREQSNSSKTVTVDPVTGVTRTKCDFNADTSFTKKKHYYFYSKRGGYGKSSFMMDFDRDANADIIRDVKNLTGLSENAQFLFVDEYGPVKRFGMDDLKGLTGGTAQGFTGNRKCYGASYKPRTDVQLILLSNKHLFDCMGNLDRKAKIRKVTAADADLLNQRFFIYRLDEHKKHTQETDAAMHTEDDPEADDDNDDDDEEEKEEAYDFLNM